MYLLGLDFGGAPRGLRGGLPDSLLGLGSPLMPFRTGLVFGARPKADSARDDGTEFPESEVALIRRVLTGIRDCEFRLEPGADDLALCTSRGGEAMAMCTPSALAVMGLDVFPLKSLLVLRCMPGRSTLTRSRDGVYPRYHAVGDEGDMPNSPSIRLWENMGFGLCMLPSDPLRRRVAGMPYPASSVFVSSDSISPNNLGRYASWGGGSG